MGCEFEVDPDRSAARAAMLDGIGLALDDSDLLGRALRHPSLCFEQEVDPRHSNERLEFLGDAVIQLAVTEHLLRHLPEHTEGELTRIRSFIVRGTRLADVARGLGVGAALEMGRGAEAAGGRDSDSILGCAFEALLGALYLSHGWEATRECLLRLLEEPIADALAERERNWKGELQELTQGRSGRTPEYRLVGASGPPHSPAFRVEACLGDEVLGVGAGRSKKLAEQAAAQVALERLEAAATSPSGPALSEGTTT